MDAGAMICKPANGEVQRIAKHVLAELNVVMTPTSSEHSVAAYAAARLAELGVPDTWYYDCPALVLAGSRTCLSLSGKDYVADTQPIGSTNVVTVDLSPRKGALWGDCARTFVMEGGRVLSEPSNPVYAEGLRAEQRLHAEMRKLVTPRTSFHELHELADERLRSWGFENLDFRGNFGHSIATSRSDRVFIERGNHETLGSVPSFTFEPHIRRARSEWGFKHEDIYYFGAHGAVVEL